MLTNQYDIHPIIAEWLKEDDYNSGAAIAPEGELISVTTLLKPTREIILSKQLGVSDDNGDISDKIPSRMGQALHKSLEDFWLKKAKETKIPIHLEKRSFKKLGDYVVSGQFDIVYAGHLSDLKTTSALSVIYQQNDKNYVLQLSILRWLNQDIVKDDFATILYMFTDYNKSLARSIKNYPPLKVAHKCFNLMSIEDTNRWVTTKLHEIEFNKNLSQEEMIECSDEELWLDPPVYKYYSDTNNLKGRATKNFNSAFEAKTHLNDKGKGTIITTKGKPKRCGYCSAFSICKQKDKYAIT